MTKEQELLLAVLDAVVNGTSWEAADKLGEFERHYAASAEPTPARPTGEGRRLAEGWKRIDLHGDAGAAGAECHHLLPDGRWGCETPAQYHADHPFKFACEQHAEAMGVFEPAPTPPPTTTATSVATTATASPATIGVAIAQWGAQTEPAHVTAERQGSNTPNPTPPPGPVCAVDCCKPCGERLRDGEECDGSRHGCSPECRAAGRPLNPPKSPEPACKDWCGLIPSGCWIAQHCTPECRKAGRSLRPANKGTP